MVSSLGSELVRDDQQRHCGHVHPRVPDGSGPDGGSARPRNHVWGGTTPEEHRARIITGQDLTHRWAARVMTEFVPGHDLRTGGAAGLGGPNAIIQYLPIKA